MKAGNIAINDSVYRTCEMGDLALELVGKNTGMGYKDFITITNGWKAPSHFHTNFELHYMRRGNVRISADNRVYDVSAGSFYLITPHCTHYSISSSEDISHFVLGFGLKRRSPPVENRFSEYEYYSKLFGDIAGAEVSQGSEFMKLCCDKIEALRRTGSSTAWHKTEVLLRALFIEISEILSEKAASTSRAKPVPEGPLKGVPVPDSEDEDENARRKWTIDIMIADNYMKNPSYEELSQLLCLSRRQCIRVVRQLTGLTLNELLTKQRMSMAKMLLDSTELTLGEIALHIGYDSYSGFFTAFRKYYGTSPTAYAAGARTKPVSPPSQM